MPDAARNEVDAVDHIANEPALLAALSSADQETLTHVGPARARHERRARARRRVLRGAVGTLRDQYQCANAGSAFGQP